MLMHVASASHVYVPATHSSTSQASSRTTSPLGHAQTLLVHSRPPAQPPQTSGTPQPSSISPHTAPAAAQLRGTQGPGHSHVESVPSAWQTCAPTAPPTHAQAVCSPTVQPGGTGLLSQASARSPKTAVAKAMTIEVLRAIISPLVVGKLPRPATAPARARRAAPRRKLGPRYLQTLTSSPAPSAFATTWQVCGAVQSPSSAHSARQVPEASPLATHSVQVSASE